MLISGLCRTCMPLYQQTHPPCVAHARTPTPNAFTHAFIAMPHMSSQDGAIVGEGVKQARVPPEHGWDDHDGCVNRDCEPIQHSGDWEDEENNLRKQLSAQSNAHCG